MTPPATSSFSPSFSNSPLSPGTVLRVGFAGKRQLDRAQTATVRNRLLHVFSVIGWRLVEISPSDDATNERPVPAIAKFYSHKRPTLGLIHGLCEGADSIASGVRISSIQKSKINNLSRQSGAATDPQSSISPVLVHTSFSSSCVLRLQVLRFEETLAAWVTQITANPKRSEDATRVASASLGEGLLNEVFQQSSTHPGTHTIDPTLTRKTLPDRLWENSTITSSPPNPKPTPAPAQPPPPVAQPPIPSQRPLFRPLSRHRLPQSPARRCRRSPRRRQPRPHGETSTQLEKSSR